MSSLERRCPVCDGGAFVPFADERVDSSKISEFTYASRKPPELMCHRLVRCIDCNVVYTPVLPDISFLTRAYAEAAYDSGEEARCAAESYARALGPHLARLPQRSAAIDIGAGDGAFLAWLRKQGFRNVVGVEPSKAAIAAASDEIRPMLREGMFDATTISDLEPSLICSFMTLEHVLEPEALIRSAWSALSPGGMVAVVVHNWRGSLNRIMGLRSPIIDIEHLQLFDPQSIRTLLAKAGFQSVSVQAITNAYPLKYWLRLSPLPQGVNELLASMLARAGVEHRQLALNVGNLLAVGQKASGG